MKKLGIIGEYDSTFPPHIATNKAIEYSSTFVGITIKYEWISTDEITKNMDQIVKQCGGFWIAPGSPYKNMEAALRIIKYARVNNIPVLGTCGGFQHIVIEYARNVLHIKDAEHAEYDPYASELVVNHLTCTLAGQELKISISDQRSKTFSLYQSIEASEQYYCNFGLNPKYQQQLHESGLKVVGTDDTNEARILELSDHIFFIATLFVPQNSSTKEKPHPIITGFINALK